MLTAPYVFNAEDARKMTQAGADILVAHMGLTTSGSIGAQSGKSLDNCVEEIQKIRDAAIKVRPDIIVLCHGGPIAKPEDAKYVLERVTGLSGFFGDNGRIEDGELADARQHEILERLDARDARTIVDKKNVRFFKSHLTSRALQLVS